MRKTLFVMLAVAFAAQPASASIQLPLGIGNAAISGFTGPYGTVDVDLTSSTTAKITFTSAFLPYLFGDGGSVAVNVNAASWTLGAITGTSATGFTPGPFSNGGAGNEDGFGSFNQTINSFDGLGHSSTEIKFTLTNTSGTWATANDILTGNASGYLAAAHIFVSDNGDASKDALATGYATNGGGPGAIVPEAASVAVWLLLTGSVALAGTRRRATNAA